jgi:germination protein M
MAWLKRAKMAVTLLICPILFTGCAIGDKANSSEQIDPPPEHTQQETTDQVKTSSTSPISAELKEQYLNGTKMYFLTDTGYIVPYTIPVEKKQIKPKDALSYLVQAGPAKGYLPKGFSPVLPAGTTIKGLQIKDGTATVNFSKEFLDYDKKLEKHVLDAVTWTLTEFPEIKVVNIEVEGKRLDKMPQEQTPAQHLTRENGINLEVAEGVNLSQSMPVTLYFLGQNEENMVYFVPVTRMINRQENRAEATLKELIKGPKQNSGLLSAIDVNTEVRRVEQKGNLITADFGEQLLQYGSQQAASKDALQSIVLSLTENNMASQVKITVKGENSVGAFGEKGQNLDAPLSRPQMINPSEL